MGMTSGTEKAVESQRRIVDAARHEVECKGILGLRVQDVARNAGVSVPLIYKYFGDRDGLLAEVLSQMFVDCSVRNLERASLNTSTNAGTASLDTLLVSLIPSRGENVAKERALAVQMLAASAEIPALAERLAETQKNVHSRVHALLSDAFASHGMDDSATIAALALLLQSASLGLIYNDLLGDDAVSEDALSGLIRVLVNAIAEGHTTKAS